MLNIKQTLILFKLASGLQVNFHKIMIIGINMRPESIKVLADSLWRKTGILPFSYLSIPIGGNPSHLNLWNPIIERMEKKLASWKGGLLSLGGRATLIKAYLSNLPLYITCLCSLFWWGSQIKSLAFKTISLVRFYGEKEIHITCCLESNRTLQTIRWAGDR